MSGKQRWIMTQFFKPSFTKNPTLEELRNGKDHNLVGVYDSTDMDIAKEVLRRADLADSHIYNDLCEIFAEALSEVEDPHLFVNPNARFMANKAAELEAEQEAEKTQSAKEVSEKTPVSTTPKSTSGKSTAGNRETK